MSVGRGIFRSVMSSCRHADGLELPTAVRQLTERIFHRSMNRVVVDSPMKRNGLHRWRRYLGSRNVAKPNTQSWSGRALLYGSIGEAILLSTNTPVISEGQRKQLHDEMILNIKRGILFLRDEKFKEAEDILHLALAGARQIGEQRGEVYILDLLANLYFEQQKYEQAETVFKEVIKRELALGKPQDSEGIIEVSAKLARIYGLTDQYEKAKAGFDFCLQKLETSMSNLTEEKKEEVVDLFLKVIQWGSEFLLSFEDKAEDSVLEAADLIEMGLEKVQQLGQTGSEAYQTLASNLSTLYSWQNRIEDAIAVATETIKLAVTSEHWSLSHFYLNLAQIYAQNGDVKSAREAAEKAMDSAKKSKDPEVEKDIKLLNDELEKKMSELK
ncbi:hypothetical protein RvY_12686 [Ramazzottius varieornatus]|uniref:MalT-like TPR region domain-containing protein n=1 Tax=Ramazzottius varieornatus TaxID=947166 RepID=A0A1D1VKC0_RAMVA|nr:hypothetical protein RvY_12686 [Ramazzottius varieornatus]